jgi:hypothetical protein
VEPVVVVVVAVRVVRVRVLLDMTSLDSRFVIDGGHAPAGAGVAPGALPVCAGHTTMDASFGP